jgi:hypothetical protein
VRLFLWNLGGKIEWVFNGRSVKKLSSIYIIELIYFLAKKLNFQRTEIFIDKLLSGLQFYNIIAINCK